MPVRAVGVGQDDGVNDQGQLITTGNVLVGGVQVASSRATFVPGTPTGTTLPFSGPIVFTARVGAATLTAQVNGGVDVSTGDFSATSTSVRGTGVLAPVSGQLQFTGHEDLSTGAFGEDITGRLCVGD